MKTRIPGMIFGKQVDFGLTLFARLIGINILLTVHGLFTEKLKGINNLIQVIYYLNFFFF